MVERNEHVFLCSSTKPRHDRGEEGLSVASVAGHRRIVLGKTSNERSEVACLSSRERVPHILC